MHLLTALELSIVREQFRVEIFYRDRNSYLVKYIFDSMEI